MEEGAGTILKSYWSQGFMYRNQDSYCYWLLKSRAYLRTVLVSETGYTSSHMKLQWRSSAAFPTDLGRSAFPNSVRCLNFSPT